MSSFLGILQDCFDQYHQLWWGLICRRADWKTLLLRRIERAPMKKNRWRISTFSLSWTCTLRLRGECCNSYGAKYDGPTQIFWLSIRVWFLYDLNLSISLTFSDLLWKTLVDLFIFQAVLLCRVRIFEGCTPCFMRWKTYLAWTLSNHHYIIIIIFFKISEICEGSL